MPLTNLERLRLGVGDASRNFMDTVVGDGSTLVFQLSAYPVVADSETVYHDGVAQSSGFTLTDATGRLVYTIAPGNGVVIMVIGQATFFSDTELNDVLTRHSNDIRGSTIEVLEWLMARTAEYFRWATNQGIEIDQRQVFRNWLDLHERLLKLQETDSFDGDQVRWPETQEDYT